MTEEPKEDLRKYAGKWVALCGKKVVASCEKPEVFQVPKEEEIL